MMEYLGWHFSEAKLFVAKELLHVITYHMHPQYAYDPIRGETVAGLQVVEKWIVSKCFLFF
jgi:hypothetical protein